MRPTDSEILKVVYLNKHPHASASIEKMKKMVLGIKKAIL
jgi:hypothetical protein